MKKPKKQNYVMAWGHKRVPDGKIMPLAYGTKFQADRCGCCDFESVRVKIVEMDE